MAFYAGASSVNYENSIISSPNSALSIDQRGGITAGTINVEFPKHQVNAEFIARLNKYLPKDKAKIIKITSVMGDGEAFQLAAELKAYLESENWKVDGISQAIYTEPIVGIIVKSVDDTSVEFIIGSKP